MIASFFRQIFQYFEINFFFRVDEEAITDSNGKEEIDG